MFDSLRLRLKQHMHHQHAQLRSHQAAMELGASDAAATAEARRLTSGQLAVGGSCADASPSGSQQACIGGPARKPTELGPSSSTQQAAPDEARDEVCSLSQLHAADLETYDSHLEAIIAAAAANRTRFRTDGWGGMHQPAPSVEVSRVQSWVSLLPDASSPDTPPAAASVGPEAPPALSTASHSWHDPSYEAQACAFERPRAWASTQGSTISSNAAYIGCCVRLGAIFGGSL